MLQNFVNVSFYTAEKAGRAMEKKEGNHKTQVIVLLYIVTSDLIIKFNVKCHERIHCRDSDSHWSVVSGQWSIVSG